MKGLLRSKLVLTIAAFLIIAAAIVIPLSGSITHSHAAAPAHPLRTIISNPDCNGLSPIQKYSTPFVCADIGGKDNGYYIGHDEPSVQFISDASGSGNNLVWKITLPKENPLPATQTFENYITFWFSMALCDPSSFPFTPCTPNSDSNPTAKFQRDTSAAGSALLEMQFYPPAAHPLSGQGPICPSTTTQWCAAMTIDSFENNKKCDEPIQAQFILNDSIAQKGQPLFMNQGDTVQITIRDTSAGVLNNIIDDNSGASGSMVASAANGFFHTDPKTCNKSPFSFHPEFDSAKSGNFLPWGAEQINVGLAVEIGHFEKAHIVKTKNGKKVTTKIVADNDSDDLNCQPGPVIPGCTGDPKTKTGDTDFDGTSYQQDWPNGTANTATSFLLSSVLGNGVGPLSSSFAEGEPFDYAEPYSQLLFETDVLASVSTLGFRCTLTGHFCVPPPGAAFYPFYALSGSQSSTSTPNCVLTFGNDIKGATTNDFGKDAQYGTRNILGQLAGGWNDSLVSSGLQSNPCIPVEGEND